MAQSETSGGSSQGPWIIAGAIVLAGLIVVIALVMMNSGGSSTPSPTPVASSSAPAPEPTATKTHTRSPRPSPSVTQSPSPSPTASPSPAIDPAVEVRQVVQDAAEADRPSDVRHVGNVQFYKDSACATREGGSANVRYNSAPKAGIFIVCKNTHGRWKVTQGPLYGE